MTGTPHCDSDKSKFNEKNVDDFYELGIINTDQMWKLREAVDIWEEAQRKYRKKFKETGLSEPVSYKDVPKEERPINRQGPQERQLNPNELLMKIIEHVKAIKDHNLSGRHFGKLRTCERTLGQISASIRR